MKISAIICTHDGSKYLHKSIISLISQSLPKEDYEIIIVDNNSRDGTKEIVCQFLGMENLKYVFEPILGLSQARNTGFKNAEGEYISYLDDDAVASRDWLRNIIKAFKKYSNIGAVGGKVEPIWEAKPPLWLNDFMKGYLSLLDWSDKPLVLKSEWLTGTNIAFKREFLEQEKGFSTELGRKDGTLLSKEEAILLDILREKNQLVYYDPNIMVKHHIPELRMDKKWFIKRAFWQGISDLIADNILRVKTDDKIREIVKKTKEYLDKIPSINDEAKILELKMLIATNVGYLFGDRFEGRNIKNSIYKLDKYFGDISARIKDEISLKDVIS